MLEKIGNCKVIEEVASGGMAVVYRATQDHLNRTVAIKALKTSVASEEALVTRFEREAQSLANLQHENIIHVYDFHREQGALFIVMEYVEGIDLYDLLESAGKMPYDVAAIIALQVARALDYVHYRGIIHRDIKPANIMLSNQGGVKLMDFGIARDDTYASDLTEAGTGIGTPSYMSPEQILGDPLDAGSDIFSLGIVLYQMLTGQKPFIEDEKFSVMHRIRLERQESARKINPDIPRELERIVEKCLQKESRHRFRSAQNLVMTLERFIAKHVDINYHSRLVWFLREKQVLSNEEAETFLNATNGGALAGPQSKAAKFRDVLTRSAITQAIIVGVLALWTISIHLLDVGKSPLPAEAAIVKRTGFVRVLARPWGAVTVQGSDDVILTPMDAPIRLEVGKQTLTVANKFYKPMTKKIVVEEGSPAEPRILTFDFLKLGESVKLNDSADAQSKAQNK